MNEVGKLFEEGEYFVGDLIYAGELMTDAVDILKPYLASGESTAKAKMILCAVKDDLHDISKNIVRIYGPVFIVHRSLFFCTKNIKL